MMNTILKTSLLSFIILAMTAVFRTAGAFFMPQLAIDPWPVFKPSETVITAGKSLGHLAHTAQKTINTTETTLNNAKAAAMAAYSGELTSLLDVGNINSGQKEIVDCNYLGHKYKMTKADEVAEISRLLFLQYPVNPKKDTAGAQKYDAYRQSFYRDSLMEIYTAALALEKDLETTLKPSVDESIKCIKGEGTNCGMGGASPDGNNDAAFVEGKALEATANVYEMLLKVTALKAQLAAVKVIGTSTPGKYVEGYEDTPIVDENNEETDGAASTQQQSSLLEEKGVVYASAQISSTQSIGFAQVGMSKAVSTSLSDIEVQSKLSTNTSQQIVDSTLSFIMAPEDTSWHPYTDAADKMAELDKIAPISEVVDEATAVHNLIVKLPEYKNAAETLNEVKEAYNKALEDLKVSNQCALTYLGRRYRDPQIPWAGRNLGANINNADIRKGISGWALEAYETAKAAQVSSDAGEDASTLNVDFDAIDLSDISDTEKGNQIIQSGGANDISTNKKEQGAKEARESGMISWQIGSEAAHLLSSSPSKWGSVSKKEAVWTDVKTFYNQYLQFKYDNIRGYLKSYSKNDVLAIVTERLKGNKEVKVDNNKKQQAIQAATQQLDKDIKADSALQTAELSAQTSSHNSQLASLQSRRKDILAKMEVVDAKQKELSDKLSDLRNKAQDDAVNSMQATVTHKTTFPVGSYEVVDEGSASSRKVADADEDSNVFNKSTAENKQNSEIDDTEQELQKQNNQLKSLENQLASLDKEITTYRLGASSKVSSLLERIRASKLKKSDSVMNKISELDVSYSKDVKTALMDVLSKKTFSNPLLTPLIVYENIDRAAGEALDNLYNKVDARIKAAQQQLWSMGDDLYDPLNHGKVVEIHQSMINDIKAMTLTVAAAGINSIGNISLYAKLEEADTTAEEEDYFVGATAKVRDIKAPKAIFEIKLPPLREAVHFDEIDWQNVSPYSEGVSKSGIIMKSDFLNYGGKIPEIWKYMLKDNAFVEKSLDLKSALNQGCEAVALYRGGVLPCKVKDSAIVLDVNAEGKYIRGSQGNNLITCAGIEMKSGKPHHILRDEDITFSIFFGNEKAEKTDCPYSELGTLLDADDNGNLYFRQSAYDAFYGVVYEQKHTDKELNSKENLLHAIYDQAMLNRNQTGDFLVFFENEQTQRKNLEETQKDYDEMMQEFYDVLKSQGFTPSSDFDLSKSSDYALARQKLDSIKNNKISQALSDLGEVDVADNTVVQERIDIIKSMISALQKDNEETTIISAGVDDDNHLDEDIKSSKVNEEVADRFTKSLDKSAEQAKQGLSPYCPNY